MRGKAVLLIVIVLSAVAVFALLYVANVPVNVSQLTVVPGESIQDAINLARAGATILVRNGTYIEERYPIVVNKTVTLIGESVDATIVDGGGTELGVFLVRSNGVRIRSLTILNTAKNSEGVAAVHLANVDNVEITDCRLRECIVGILLTNVSNSVIARNKIMNNRVEGILLRNKCTSNVIFGNMISNNFNGIRTTDFTCTGNQIHHNNFVNNTYQTMLMGISGAWDDGYPSGGNYWSDYAGMDYYSGPYQNVTGSDGIGDTPYGSGLDRYPFMGLVQSLNAST